MIDRCFDPTALPHPHTPRLATHMARHTTQLHTQPQHETPTNMTDDPIADLLQSVSEPITFHTWYPPEPWETWGVAARWNPQHGWHQP